MQIWLKFVPGLRKVLDESRIYLPLDLPSIGDEGQNLIVLFILELG